MLFSKPTQYAFRALLHLGTLPVDKIVTVRQLAQAIEVPMPVLSKVIQNLSRGRLVKTVKGPGGGVGLAHPPQEITLWKILEVIEGPDAFADCLVGSHDCASVTNCMLHNEWAPIKQQLEGKLGNITIAQMGQHCPT